MFVLWKLGEVLNVLRFTVEFALNLGEAVPVFGEVCKVLGKIIKIGSEVHEMTEHMIKLLRTTCDAIEVLETMKEKMQEGFGKLKSTPREKLQKVVNNLEDTFTLVQQNMVKWDTNAFRLRGLLKWVSAKSMVKEFAELETQILQKL